MKNNIRTLFSLILKDFSLLKSNFFNWILYKILIFLFSLVVVLGVFIIFIILFQLLSLVSSFYYVFLFFGILILLFFLFLFLPFIAVLLVSNPILLKDFITVMEYVFYQFTYDIWFSNFWFDILQLLWIMFFVAMFFIVFVFTWFNFITRLNKAYISWEKPSLSIFKFKIRDFFIFIKKTGLLFLFLLILLFILFFVWFLIKDLHSLYFVVISVIFIAVYFYLSYRFIFLYFEKQINIKDYLLNTKGLFWRFLIFFVPLLLTLIIIHFLFSLLLFISPLFVYLNLFLYLIVFSWIIEMFLYSFYRHNIMKNSWTIEVKYEKEEKKEPSEKENNTKK